eukprot:COSAG02_NODE_3070_length_7426_cov_22.244438_3_plen_138_part_00
MWPHASPVSHSSLPPSEILFDGDVSIFPVGGIRVFVCSGSTIHRWMRLGPKLKMGVGDAVSMAICACAVSSHWGAESASNILSNSPPTSKLDGSCLDNADARSSQVSRRATISGSVLEARAVGETKLDMAGRKEGCA